MGTEEATWEQKRLHGNRRGYMGTEEATWEQKRLHGKAFVIN